MGIFQTYGNTKMSYGEAPSAGERYWQAQVWQPMSAPEERAEPAPRQSMESLGDILLKAIVAKRIIAHAEQGLPWPHIPSSAKAGEVVWRSEPDYDAILLAARRRREFENPPEPSTKDLHGPIDSRTLHHACSISPNDKPLMQQARLGAR